MNGLFPVSFDCVAAQFDDMILIGFILRRDFVMNFCKTPLWMMALWRSVMLGIKALVKRLTYQFFFFPFHTLPLLVQL
jgi:hypothetical protein